MSCQFQRRVQILVPLWPSAELLFFVENLLEQL